jgi:hypothetical protein
MNKKDIVLFTAEENDDYYCIEFYSSGKVRINRDDAYFARYYIEDDKIYWSDGQICSHTRVQEAYLAYLFETTILGKVDG